MGFGTQEGSKGQVKHFSYRPGTGAGPESSLYLWSHWLMSECDRSHSLRPGWFTIQLKLSSVLIHLQSVSLSIASERINIFILRAHMYPNSSDKDITFVIVLYSIRQKHDNKANLHFTHHMCILNLRLAVALFLHPLQENNDKVSNIHPHCSQLFKCFVVCFQPFLNVSVLNAQHTHLTKCPPFELFKQKLAAYLHFQNTK